MVRTFHSGGIVWQLWIRYWLQIPGLPNIGDPNVADVIAVQAFGRNSLPDDQLHEIGQIRQELHFDDGAVFRRLHDQGFDPGRPNQHLAHECRLLMERYNLPAIMQWEVVAALGELWYTRYRDQIVTLWPPGRQGQYYSTLDVKRDTWRVMQKRGWSEAIELAHRHQVVRAFFILRRIIGRSPITVPIATDDFDDRSVQHAWTFSLPAHLSSGERVGE